MTACANDPRATPDGVPLIRAEVIALQRAEAGETLALVPLSLTALAGFLAAAAVLIVTFLSTFEYTRRIKASGRLVASEGVVRVYPPVDGIVVARFVGDADPVVAGQPLLTISTDRRSHLVGSIAQGVARQLKTRADSLAQDMQRTRALRSRDQAALTRKVALLQQQSHDIAMEVDSQQHAVRTSDSYLDKFKSLARQGFVAASALEEKEQANLDAHTRLHAMLRDQGGVEQNLRDAQAELANFADRIGSELGAMAREAATLEQATLENEGRREVTVFAGIGGSMTGLSASLGQVVSSTQVLGSIVPDNVRFQLQLNIPTAAAGMAADGQRVRVRYASFPHERFGQAAGTITSLARIAFTAAELKVNDDSKELFYPARVDLDSQVVAAYGRSFRLREGMLAEADILLEKRTLIEWFLEPLLAARSRYGEPGPGHSGASPAPATSYQ